MKRLYFQHGLTTVETAFIGALMLTLVFGVIEFSRLLWSWGTLAEATRRGARVAAVCPPFNGGEAVAPRVAVFRNPDGTGTPVLSGLDVGNINVRYLNAASLPVATPGCANLGTIRYVEVSIQNYQIDLAIPFFNFLLTAPDFRTVIPAENLGFVPDPADATDPYFGCFDQFVADCTPST